MGTTVVVQSVQRLRYGLDDQGSSSGRTEFSSSPQRLDLLWDQPIQWVPRSFPRAKAAGA
jgi:hypothetical protein